ncbi:MULTISPECIES: substrate-binding protein [unclassified Roseitalea]|uniref:substrate-binding protein n=1 Tax=unclassified Roseitalea TaxID=2639107 RepID=UPI00273F40C1|nr:MULTISPECIES: substrate-binding protein [unclassified Roseitalea]
MKFTKRNASRRQVLKGGAAVAGALATPHFFVKNAWAQGECATLGNFPVEGPEVVFGFSVPKTGAYADEGADELRAQELAVEHINNGGGILNTLQPLSLTGQGVLGKKVTYVSGDDQTNPDATRQVARRMIERDGVIMFNGGSSSATAVAAQSLAQELGVVFMNGLTHANETTGKDRRRYGFRQFFNTHMTGLALGPVLAENYGTDRAAFHLTADYNWGHSMSGSIKDATEGEGWSTINRVSTPLGATDYSQFLTAFLNSDADVLVLNHYGNDMVNSVTQAVQFGVRDMQKNGRQVELVVPLYSRLMAQGAGDNIEGVFGTTNWNWSLDNPGAKAFVDSFTDKYGFPPSQAAHTCYVQVILYADACERAGTFYAPEVIRALEGHEYEGDGYNSASLYRAEDHQSFHDVFLVRGKSASERASEFDLLQIVSEVPRSTVEYPVDTFEGELGDYCPTA